MTWQELAQWIAQLSPEDLQQSVIFYLTDQGVSEKNVSATFAQHCDTDLPRGTPYLY